MIVSVTSLKLSALFHNSLKSARYLSANGDGIRIETGQILLPRSHPNSVVVNSLNGRYTYLLSSFATDKKPFRAPFETLVLKQALRRIQSAHSLAIAFWDSWLRNFISKSEPNRLRSRLNFGIKNSRFSLDALSLLKVGDVKIKRNSSIDSNSSFRTS